MAGFAVEVNATVTAVVRQAAQQARTGVRSTVEGLMNEGVLREPPLSMPAALRIAEPAPPPARGRPALDDDDDDDDGDGDGDGSRSIFGR
jgi:hypothetical protein